jgi:hypothetical protein
MRDRPTAVMYDLDSTVADTRHRWHLSPMVNPAATWGDYSSACAGDRVLPGTAARMRLDWREHQVHINTGRSAVALVHTETWLNRPDVVRGSWDFLRMRPADDDDTPNGELKVRYIREVQARGIDVVLAYEDWGPAAEYIYAETGVPVLGINPFYPEEETALQRSAADHVGGGL